MATSSLFASIGSAFSLVRPSSPPSPRNPQLAAFESELSFQLHRLTPTTLSQDNAGDGIASCAWLCRALDIVLSAHASMEAFLPDLHSALAGGDTKWLDAYLDDSAKLLDICNALKDAMAGFGNYQASLDAALHSLQKGGLSEPQLRRAKNALVNSTNALTSASHLRSAGAGGQHRSKLEKCSSVLRRMGEKLSTHHTFKSNFSVASYATQLATVFICGVLTSALSVKSRRPLSTVSPSHHQQASWSPSLNNLQHTVKEHVDKKKIKGVVSPFKELENTHSEACTLYDCFDKLLLNNSIAAGQNVDNLRSHIKSLQVSLEDLSQGLSSLEFQVDKLFKVLIASRLALLEVYSQSRCTHSR